MPLRRSEGEELEYPFFEGDGSSSDELRDYDMAGDDYKGPLVFDDDKYEEELMPVYDTAIEDVIEEEEGFVGKGGFGGKEDNIEDVVVVVNDLCSSMIQTSISVDFSKTIDSNPHELIWLQKGNLVESNILIGKKYQGYLKGDTQLDVTTNDVINDKDKVDGEDEVDEENEIQEVDEDYESDEDPSDEH
nr:hypothetical protein [Tanacetum cinerariifolium]